jgi:hypothetical protein
MVVQVVLEKHTQSLMEHRQYSTQAVVEDLRVVQVLQVMVVKVEDLLVIEDQIHKTLQQIEVVVVEALEVIIMQVLVVKVL